MRRRITIDLDDVLGWVIGLLVAWFLIVVGANLLWCLIH
jgi:hypothetical protein